MTIKVQRVVGASVDIAEARRLGYLPYDSEVRTSFLGTFVEFQGTDADKNAVKTTLETLRNERRA